MGRPPKYVYKIGDIVDDLECINIIKDKQNYTNYEMKCVICGRTKLMLGPTINRHSGTTHRACGQGLKTKNEVFYERWKAMRVRTTNSNYEHYEDYGGRGIDSEEFKSFIDFYDAMYPSFVEAFEKFGNRTSLERIDYNKSYTKENCTWIELFEQQGNQRKTLYFIIIDSQGNKTYHKNVRLFCREKGYNESVIYDLLNGRIHNAYGLSAKKITKEEYESYINNNKKCND